MNYNISLAMFIVMHNNIETAIEFYKKFGFELIFHVPQKWAEFNIQGIKMGLAATDQELPERHTGIVLKVANLYATYKALKEDGVTFINEPVEALHGIMVSFKDPGNNILDLYQPTPEKLQEALKKAEEDAKK